MRIFSQRGVRVGHSKRTSGLKPVRIDHCERVTLPMKQHIGAPCVPCVAPGEHVLAGQLVGRADAPLCAPVHASISGTVKKIEVARMPGGEDVQAVVIESDGGMERIQASPPQVSSLEEFIQAVRTSGLVGLGGAGFPAHAKLRSAAKAGVDILLVNAAECEPYITADHREALDAAADLMAGIRHICKWMGLKEAVIGIENNKGDAIALLQGICAAETAPELKLRVGVLPSRYPQGAEKVFIHSLTGRVVPLGKLPPDVGVLTMNIGSVAFLGRYMQSGMPLISRTVTVDGDAVPHPMNLRAPIGIHIRELCERCGVVDKPAKIILGGPMMGAAAPDLNSAISKCNNAVLLFSAEQAGLKPETACIRCGCCVMACPMNLQPLKLEQAYFNRDAQALEHLSAPGCMECGCCSYVCPAGRELVQRIRLGKIILRNAQAKEGKA